jgi:uncharacterized protein YndB with AHSA1/START domain
MAPYSDRIEKQLVLKAPRARVWRALSNGEELGSWFGVKGLKGAFQPGQKVRGNITHPGYEHLVMEATIDQVQPEKLLSLRWHPHAVEPGVDYSGEPTTLVEFRLEEVSGGTQVTVVESGFDRIPAARREKAYLMNSEGWAAQLQNVERHVSAPA